MPLNGVVIGLLPGTFPLSPNLFLKVQKGLELLKLLRVAAVKAKGNDIKKK
jgi:hypothetical protein